MMQQSGHLAGYINDISRVSLYPLLFLCLALVSARSTGRFRCYLNKELDFVRAGCLCLLVTFFSVPTLCSISSIPFNMQNFIHSPIIITKCRSDTSSKSRHLVASPLLPPYYPLWIHSVPAL
ncbi:hypothetical protein BDW02DRAFT_264489 [Decorospora gaudefroyi]|uniref:Uncharacterized protein n=1 Tax=Decorospora gaudefroyi TaxID=184978 RepID=A0A6A5KKR6_9PLEO|nr:hypothetical protein BDW02DRAFT_264489 [Decorospora gaudefroyi]